eukprot:4954463-Prymnesium_polylepis.1
MCRDHTTSPLPAPSRRAIIEALVAVSRAVCGYAVAIVCLPKEAVRRDSAPGHVVQRLHNNVETRQASVGSPARCLRAGAPPGRHDDHLVSIKANRHGAGHVIDDDCLGVARAVEARLIRAETHLEQPSARRAQRPVRVTNPRALHEELGIG